MKFKRGDYAPKAKEEELNGVNLSKIKEVIKDEESYDVLKAAKKGKIVESADL
jgi:ribosomal protein L15